MTDKEKFIQLFDEVGIKHNVTDDGIEIDAEEVNGGTHNLFIQFYGDEYNHRYQEIIVYEA